MKPFKLPDGNVLVSIPNGYGPHQITGEVYHEKVYEQLESLMPGMTVLDVGASIGIFSLKASKIVGETGKVISIEPDPESYAALQDNIAANNASNIVTVNVAAWNSYSSLKFNNSVRPTSRYVLAPDNQLISVPALPLDDVLSNLGINYVDFIKIDIEGAAYEALQGLPNTLNNTGYLAIAAYHKMLGLNRSNTENPNQISALLSNQGFSTKILRYYFGLVPYVYAWKG